MKDQWERFWKGRKTKVTWSKRRIIKILNKYAKGRVLDAGCGSGFFSKYFVESGHETFALDYSKKALEMTKKLDSRIKTKKGNVLNMPFKDEYFDIVFSDGLLEHFKNPKKVLLEFKRVLRNDGIVITFVPNKYSYWLFVKPFIMREIEERRSTLKPLLDLHKSIGLEILECGGISVLPIKFSPEFLGKWIGRLLYVVAKK